MAYGGGTLLGAAMQNLTPPPSQYANVGAALREIMQTHEGLAAEQRVNYRQDQRWAQEQTANKEKMKLTALSDTLNNLYTQRAKIAENGGETGAWDDKIGALEKAIGAMVDADISSPIESRTFSPDEARGMLQKYKDPALAIKRVMEDRRISEDEKILFINYFKKIQSSRERNQAIISGIGRAAGGAVQSAGSAIGGLGGLLGGMIQPLYPTAASKMSAPGVGLGASMAKGLLGR